MSTAEKKAVVVSLEALNWYKSNGYISHLILEDAGMKAQATLRELEEGKG